MRKPKICSKLQRDLHYSPIWTQRLTIYDAQRAKPKLEALLDTEATGDAAVPGKARREITLSLVINHAFHTMCMRFRCWTKNGTYPYKPGAVIPFEPSMH